MADELDMLTDAPADETFDEALLADLAAGQVVELTLLSRRARAADDRRQPAACGSLPQAASLAAEPVSPELLAEMKLDAAVPSLETPSRPGAAGESPPASEPRQVDIAGLLQQLAVVVAAVAASAAIYWLMF